MAGTKEKAAAAVETAAKETKKADEVVEKAAKAPAKRGRKPASTTAKKTTKAADDVKSETVVLQFYGQDVNVEDVIQNIKDAYTGAGHRASSIKKLQVYLKPEESAAYYVINDKQAGKVDLF